MEGMDHPPCPSRLCVVRTLPPISALGSNPPPIPSPPPPSPPQLPPQLPPGMACELSREPNSSCGGAPGTGDALPSSSCTCYRGMVKVGRW